MSRVEDGNDPSVWLNTGYLPLSRARISPLDRGFLYGDGVFETMRAEKGRILDLEKHLERLQGALEELKIRVRKSIDWEDVLTGLLVRNDLTRLSASTKIIVTRGTTPGLGLPSAEEPTVCLLAQPYVAPTESAYEKGWMLVPCRSGFSPPLARYKSLNYLYFMAARQEALDRGGDEAVILDPNGNITETAAGTLLIRSDGNWWTPHSDYQLPSVTLARLLRFLEESGQAVQHRVGTLQDLEAAETVWVVNSLMLIMPATQLDGKPVPRPSADLAALWRERLLRAFG